DWTRLYEADARPRRISLPTYPFARERYWIDAAKLDGLFAGAVTPPSLPISSKSTALSPALAGQQRSKRFLSKHWRLSQAPQPRDLAQNILILADAASYKLALQLLDHFPLSRIVDSPAISRPDDAESYSCTGWIDLVGCGQTSDSFVQWMPFLQKLIEARSKDGVTALGVTRGVEAHQNETINLSGASHAGLYRLLRGEYGRLRAKHIDVEALSSDEDICAQILLEFSTAGDEVEVCYRGGQRYCARLEEVALADESSLRAGPQKFPEQHVLWITGGTRGIGYLCAQHFVRSHGVRRLVLTGREQLPPREEWDAYQEQNSSVGNKIRSIRMLEAEGAEVRVLSISLTDEKALRQKLHEVKDTLGPVGGVIHCAGTIDIENPAFIRKQVETTRDVLAPKTIGLDNMVKCFSAEPLSIFVVFSSVSAEVPSLAAGQLDYAIANAYMDYVAHAYARTLPIISIQWPNWKDAGLGEVRSRAYESTGLLSHSNAEGLGLLDQLLGSRQLPVILPAIVSAESWHPDRLQQLEKAARRTINGSGSPVATAEAVSGPLAEATKAWLVALVSRELKIEETGVDLDTPLQDYGVDSILLAQLLRPIGELIASELDPSILYEHSTLSSLSRWLVHTHADALSKSLDLTPANELPVADALQTVNSTPMHRSFQQRDARSTEVSDIAVVGLSCRFPGANDIDAYWKMLSDGRSAIRRASQDRWRSDGTYYAGLLDDISHFDPKFFLIPKADARAMDPQALLVLEESLKLWHHAGYSLREIKGTSVGVYLGARSQHSPDPDRMKNATNPIMALGQNYLAANISRFYDLRGPSLVVDTACSSALVAMNIAMQALRAGDIAAAIVGGVNVLNSDAALRIFKQRGILNSEPHFHIFDRRARGVILGEGVGMVLLKTFDQAVKDGDQIYAVIKALATNNDGRTAGPAAPNLQAQKQVMEAALAKSGKTAEDITHIDVNGSGSEVTDLLELKAIETVYRQSSTSPCSLGSMKPNIGHPLCAEGIASFIKVALMLHHRQWVPFLSATQPMKHYNLDHSPFHFVREAMAWDDPQPVAAINSFADGGTNAHVILQAAATARAAARHPIPPPPLHRINVYGDPDPAPTIVPAPQHPQKNGANFNLDPAIEVMSKARSSANGIRLRADFWREQ
uniref:type I polyketide synthase n=1 Tax=Bradyrhizobium sp. Leaf401 TaxID=2876564 RepID=UPI001E3CDA42